VAYFGDRDISVLRIPGFEPVFSGHPIAHPSDIDFSPDGDLLAVRSSSGRIIILDARTGKMLTDFRNQKEGEGTGAFFSSCGDYLVSASWNGVFTVHDRATGNVVFSQAYPDCCLGNLSTSQDRQFFVYEVSQHPPSVWQPSPPATVMLHSWSMENNACRELPQRWSFINAVQVSPTGRKLAVIYGAPPDTLEVYDLEQSKVVAGRAVRFGGTGCSIGWSPSEDLIAVNGDHQCQVFEMPTLAVKHEYAVRYPCHVGFSPDSRFFALGCWRTSFIIPLEHMATFTGTPNLAARSPSPFFPRRL